MSVLPSGLSEVIGDDEDLARFLTQSSHYSLAGVHSSAFMPSPKDRATSVSRHGRQPVEVLKRLGMVAAGSRHLHGAAFIKASTVRGIDLAVDAKEPPDRHALIRGWPWAESDPKQQKAEQKKLALRLAATAGQPVLFDA